MKIKETDFRFASSLSENLDSDCVIRFGQAVSGDSHHRIIDALSEKEAKPLNEITLRQAYERALKEAVEDGGASLDIMIPQSDQVKLPVVAAAKILSQELIKALRGGSPWKTITLCGPDEKTNDNYSRIINGYLGHILDPLKQPYLTVDVIIEMPAGVVIIKRSNPPYGWALPGGFVDYGESLDECVVREAKEETNLTLSDLRQMHTYSRPGRDVRFHTVTTVFIAKGSGEAHAGDDAADLKIVDYKELVNQEYAFNHKEILGDYLRCKESQDKIK